MTNACVEKIGNIYTRIISKENLYHAAHMAARGRRFRDTTADFNFFLEQEIERLHGDLAAKTYCHGRYRMFTIHDPKERNIAAAPFRDRVVHHAVHDVIEPVIDKTFIRDSYACRRNKGTHKAVEKAQDFLRHSVYCFHGDIKKYFQSIDHGILKGIIRQRITDQDLLWLLDVIIDSALSLRGDEGDEAISKNEIASGKKRPRNDGRRGLPIGNLTSQFFANLYLNKLDHFVKFELKAGRYLRYMDDFLVLDDDKNALRGIRVTIRDFLKNNLALDLHEAKSQIYDSCGGIKFLGFRLYEDHRRIASANMRRFRKRLKKFAYLLEKSGAATGFLGLKIRDSVRCWAAHSRYANTNGLRLRIYENLAKYKPYLSALLKDILLDGKLFFRERERERESRMRRAIFVCNYMT